VIVTLDDHGEPVVLTTVADGTGRFSVSNGEVRAYALSCSTQMA